MIDRDDPQYPGGESEPLSRNMIGEPIKLGSGEVLTIYGCTDGDSFDFSVDGITMTYSLDDLGIIGDGDSRQGMMRVAQHFHRTNGETAILGLRRPFQDVIEAVHLESGE